MPQHRAQAYWLVFDHQPAAHVLDHLPDGLAADAGLQQGDVIEEVNRQPVRSQSDLQNAIGKSVGHPALMLINRGGQRVYIAVPTSK